MTSALFSAKVFHKSAEQWVTLVSLKQFINYLLSHIDVKNRAQVFWMILPGNKFAAENFIIFKSKIPQMQTYHSFLFLF